MEQTKNKILTGNALKMVAIITMFIDHITYAFIEHGLIPMAYASYYGGKNTDFTLKQVTLFNNLDTIGRGIGRLAFPIFIFLMIEGFLHTRNVWKYALRMLIFALISEIPFNLMVAGSILSIYYQNVYFTLLLGLLMIIAIDFFEKKTANNKALRILSSILPLLVACVIAYFLRCDYDVMGILMIYSCYMTRNYKNYMWLAMMAAMVLPMAAGITNSSYIELLGLFSFFLIAMYNGERGKYKLKYVFYAFYPVHLLIIGVIKMLIF